MLEARYVDSLDLAPDQPIWSKARRQYIALVGTPVGLQPTAAIRVSWTGKRVGAVSRVSARALHDGRTLAFLLEWADSSENRSIEDTIRFADAAAVLFPAAPDAPLVTMGAEGKPVTAWYWRADDEPGRGRHLSARGLGTTRTLDQELVQTSGSWKDGRWRVVIARALRVRSDEPVAQFETGRRAQFAIAVWEGSRRERAGIKAFSPRWQPISLAPIDKKSE